VQRNGRKGHHIQLQGSREETRLKVTLKGCHRVTESVTGDADRSRLRQE